MKVKLLKKLRKRYTWGWDEIKMVWRIRDAGTMNQILETSLTWKAVDKMAAPLLAFSEIIPWYRKIYRLHYKQ